MPFAVLVVLQVDVYNGVWRSEDSGAPVVNGTAQHRVSVVFPLGKRVQVVVLSLMLEYGYTHE